MKKEKLNLNIDGIKPLVEQGFSDREIIVKLGYPEDRWLSVRHIRLKKLKVKKCSANGTLNEKILKQYIDEGKSREEIAQLLNSKISSVNYALQKIKIFKEKDIHKVTPELLQEYYVEKGYTDQEIADMLGIAHNRVWEKRKKLGIDRSFKYQKLNLPLTFTTEQKDLVYGSLFGDSSIERVGESYYMRCAHGIKQKKYLERKVEILGEFCSSSNKVNWGNEKGVNLVSHTHPLFKDLYEIYYPNNDENKRITFPDQILPELTMEMLAWWYGDDGTINTVRDYKKTIKKKGNSIVIGTAFDFKDRKKFIKYLWDNFQLKSNVSRTWELVTTKNDETIKKEFTEIRIYPHQKFLDVLNNILGKTLEYKIPLVPSSNVTLKGNIIKFTNLGAIEERACKKCSKKFQKNWQESNKFCSRKCQQSYNYAKIK